MGEVNKECKVISVSNQKGGVGKTVTCVNLGIGLAREGKKVLMIDAWPDIEDGRLKGIGELSSTSKRAFVLQMHCWPLSFIFKRNRDCRHIEIHENIIKTTKKEVLYYEQSNFIRKNDKGCRSKRWKQ